MPNKSMDSFITNVVEKPQVFFGANQKIVDNALEMAKHFYDNVKKIEQVQFSPFTELLTEGFDNDQIWEEITLQNEPFLDYAKETLKSFTEQESDQSMDSDQDVEMAEQEQEEESSEEEELQQQLSSAEEEDDEMLEVKEQEESEEEDHESEEEEENEDEIPRKTSEVDDDFFNLEEFNKWTEEQEELDMLSDREGQDDEIDYDRDLDEEEDSEEEEDDDAMNDAADMTYEDFFGSKDKVKHKKPYIPKKSVTFKDEEEDEGEEEDEDDKESEGSVRDLFADDDDEEMKEDGAEKSAYEKQQERIQQQIEEFEEENIQGRHWTLQGEATAKARPVNSLLEEDLEFEHANKPVPVITQETTTTLEDMIKKRILDNMFDDVERKVDPTLKPFVPSKRVELSDEKSKKSLADLYEDDFVRQQSGDQHKDARDEALEKEHEEITDMFKTLCYKLDALSNFHYTPKAVKPEMTIVSNSAAITMEEVTPVNVSEATLLAPEEVYDKKQGDVKAATEMDQAERKRLRAQKKKLKRKEHEMKEKQLKIMQKYNPQVGEKQAKKKAVKELLGQKNVTVIGKDGQKKSTSKQVTSASLF